VTFSRSGSANRKSHGWEDDAIRARNNSLRHKKPSARTSSHNRAIERPLKIGEAAKLVGVEPYVLRFWETQFSCIHPRQSRSRHRYYSPDDIATLKYVKHLLHTEGYTISGARRFIRENGSGSARSQSVTAHPPSGRKLQGRLQPARATVVADGRSSTTNGGVHRALREIRNDLRELHKLLDAE